MEFGGGDKMTTVPSIPFKEIDTPFRWHSLELPLSNKAIRAPRVGHALVPGGTAEESSVYMFGGGSHDGALKDAFIIDFKVVQGETTVVVCKHPAEESFPERYEFSCTNTQDRNKVWIFGGATQEMTLNDVICIDSTNIITAVPSEKEPEESGSGAPSARTQGGNSALLNLKGKSYLVVFGGGLKAENAVDDGNLYLFDVDEMKWSVVDVVSDVPSPRQGHSLTVVGSRVYLYGGMNQMNLFEEMYTIDLDESPAKWIKLDLGEKHPGGRAAHWMCVDPLSISEDGKGSFYLFGGLAGDGALNDFWRFNVESKTWTEINTGDEKVTLPAARLDYAMCCFQNNKSSYILLHGGMNTRGELYGDLWVMKIA